MSPERLFTTTIIVTLVLQTTCFAACVDFDGSGRCVETGSTGRVPMPTGIERVSPPTNSSDRNNPQQEQASPKKATRPVVPSMKSVVTGTIIEGVAEGLFKSSSPKSAQDPDKHVTSVISPEAVDIQRQFEEQENQQFLRSRDDLTGQLKGLYPTANDDQLITSGGMILKGVPAADSNSHSNFFGSPGGVSPTVGLLRDGVSNMKSGLLNPEDFKKAVSNPDLTQEERERLLLRTKVAPAQLDDHPMVDSRAFVEKEHYSDVYLDIATAGGKAAATTISLSLVDEAGKRLLATKGVGDGYDELLTLGKNSVEKPKSTAAQVFAVGDFALTKAPTWTIAADGAVNAAGAMTRQAIVRYWAAKDSQQYYDPAPVRSARDKWNSWYADRNDWSKAALSRIGAGEY